VKRLLWTALLSMMCCIPVFSSAQSTQRKNCHSRQPIKVSHIRGVVADENRGVIGRVKVTLQKAKGDGLEDVASQETNNVGRFDFSAVKAGRYRLVFRHPDFYFADVPVEVSVTGWDAFWLTMSILAMDSNEPCGDRYNVEELNKSAFTPEKAAK